MIETIQRLRESKATTDRQAADRKQAEQAKHEADHASGLTAGKSWATDVASFYELQGLVDARAYSKSRGDGSITGKVRDLVDASRKFWVMLLAEVQPTDMITGDFADGFGDGAAEVWAAVKDQV